MEINQYWKKLITKLFDKTISNKELEELNRWYDYTHLDEFQKSAADEAERKHAAWQSIKKRTTPINDATSTAKKTVSFSAIAKIAAAFLVAALIGLQFWFKEPATTSPVKMITISNKLGQVSSFTLPDSSKIWLSTGSTFTYPERFGETREVSLDGEAFFDVHRNPEKPFTITSGDVITSVLGTSFNINAYPDEKVQVAVFTGKVAVKDHQSRNETVHLVKNQMVTWKPNSGFEPTTEFDPEQIAKWRQGILTFRNANMEEVIHELSKWYDIEFKLAKKSAPTCQYTGEFKNTSLENALKIIQYALRINYTINENEVLIEAPNCQRQ
ncbi:FecR family protein [Echinicola sp. 20G]|uniref:FecR family protein n=1 Tax=Echinicola sp. 20G TaxID=2781961 RepID=UPI0019111DCF|nr:FecR domain-containing protein [Echinicola sp. 20G]